jgi:hypothetical protein
MSFLPPFLFQPSKEHIWALVIGIEENPTLPADGAKGDALSVRDWLLERGTPEDNIRVLLDEEANRVSILDVFEHHLISNAAIARDAPLLVYYAGHGAQTDAPEDWISDGETDTGQTEFIIPHDALGPDGELDVNLIIADRVIGALLRRLARAKGNNITGTFRPRCHDTTRLTVLSTVIFDCCHSGACRVYPYLVV